MIKQLKEGTKANIVPKNVVVKLLMKKDLELKDVKFAEISYPLKVGNIVQTNV